MSVLTKPYAEPSVTCGFYNAINGDRTYDAEQMSAIFDGIIMDGIFGSIGSALKVTAEATPSTSVIIGSGKCWFDHSWTRNDAPLIIDCGVAPTVPNQSAIDAVVVRIDKRQETRDNTFEVIKGTPSVNPVKPTLTNDEFVHEYALCYIRRKSGNNTITDADIEDARGIETKFVTGPLTVLDPSELLTQWNAKINEFFVALDKDSRETLLAYINAIEEDFTAYANVRKSDMDDIIYNINVWAGGVENTILEWFERIQGQLDNDPAINLQMQIDENEIRQLLLCGLPDGTKRFSEDGSVITSTGTNGRKLVKVFTDSFNTCTTTLYSAQGGELGSLVKTFNDDGSTNTEIDILVTVPDGDEIEY